MKILLIAFSLSATLLAAAEDRAKDTQSQAAAPVYKPLEIPRGAVEAAPFTYRHTDTEGRKWIYRKTPFGVSRVADQPGVSLAAKPHKIDAVKAFDDGEYVRFERATPFGVQQWKSRKSDLDEVERQVWSQSQAASAAKQE